MKEEIEAIKKRLWFDVERRYKTMKSAEKGELKKLWFDVERRYKTMTKKNYSTTWCCGLM